MQKACTCRRASDRVDVIGVPIDLVTPAEVVSAYERLLQCGTTHVVNHLSAHPLVVASDDSSFADVLARADLNLPDGMGVVWGARALGASTMRERVYGPTTMLDILRWGVDRSLRHGLIGGSPDSLIALAYNLSRRFPGLQIAGTHSPPIREVFPDAVAEDLSFLGTEVDVLWVGLGTPKQQRWAELARAFRPGSVIATVGAAFDFLAGTRRQAPEWVQRSGLEWSYRLATEPRRLWHRYLVGNARFTWEVASQYLRTRSPHAKGGVERDSRRANPGP